MKYKTERDVLKTEYRDRLKRFMVIFDNAAHGLNSNGTTFTDRSNPTSLSSMAVEMKNTLRIYP